MQKRVLDSTDQHGSLKRQKLRAHAATECVNSAEQLKESLAFRQDELSHLLAGIRSFKALLDSILYCEDKALSAKPQIILKDYLNQEQLQNEDRIPLAQLFQAWDFATKIHHDSLSSAIPAIFALLLKVISQTLELREFGLALGKAVLQDENLALVSKGLTAIKEKEHLISPCLRLLNEVVTLDGGSLVSRVHAAHHACLDSRSITRCLSLGVHDDGARKLEDKPTIRANCIRYLLSLVRLSSSQAKREVFRSTAVIRALFGNLRQDSPNILGELFSTIRDHLLKDDKVDQGTKTHLLSNDHLSSISLLYREQSTETSRDKDPALIAHDFLRYVCTTPGLGLLRPSQGFYPPGTDRTDEDEVNDLPIDLGLDSVSWYRNFDGQLPICNIQLSRFLRTLKPYASQLECSLMVSIFDAAPELVADYFRSTSFSADPKLTATWVGYMSFLISSIHTTVPRYFGRPLNYDEVPPPVSVVLDNILPVRVDQKTLTRCLNQSSELITFATVHLLAAAFVKLKAVLWYFNKAAYSHGPLWQEGKNRLLDGFAQRCPSLKYVVDLYHRVANTGDNLQLEAILRLLRLFYEVVPQFASDYKVDVSLLLNQSLLKASSSDENSSKKGLSSVILGHLLSIAGLNPDTKWFHKPEALPTSLYTCLLKLHASGNDSSGAVNILEVVSEDNDLFNESTLNAFMTSLQSENEWAASNDTLSWVDDVVQRYVRKPIKYQDDLGELSSEEDPFLSPFWMALVEQWPFALQRHKDVANISLLLSRFLAASRLIGGNETSIVEIRERLSHAALSNQEACDALAQTDGDNLLSLKRGKRNLSSIDIPGETLHEPDTSSRSTVKIEPTAFNPPPDPSESKVYLTALHEATAFSVEEFVEAIRSGVFSKLILCLSSTDSDVQSQALNSLAKLSKRLSEPRVDSQCPSARQIWLLLGILDNTVRCIASSQKDLSRASAAAVPYVVTAFASMATPILVDPMNPLYEQVNTFLLRSPSFDQKKILRYWLHQMLREPSTDYYNPIKNHQTPSVESESEELALEAYVTLSPLPLTSAAPSFPFSEDPYHTGIHFLLSYVYHACRSPQDADLLRSSNVLESIFTITSTDAFLSRGLRELVVALIWRLTSIDGGSTTLITRTGAMSWLSGLICSRGVGRSSADLLGREGLKQLVGRLWETCDKQAIRRWDGGSLDSFRKAMEEEQWESLENSKSQMTKWHCGVEAIVQEVAG